MNVRFARCARLLALVALCLRLLLPALHDPRAHAHAHGTSGTGHNTLHRCSCGAVHVQHGPAPSEPRAQSGDATAVDEHLCLACELEAFAKAQPPEPGPARTHGFTIARSRPAPPRFLVSARQHARPPGRAPPMHA